MKRYAFLVRGINVGGRHKVVMEEFCRELEELGMSHVSSYINSGNLFFDSTLMKAELLLVLERFLNKAYPVIQVFSLFPLSGLANILALVCLFIAFLASVGLAQFTVHKIRDWNSK